MEFIKTSGMLELHLCTAIAAISQEYAKCTAYFQTVENPQYGVRGRKIFRDSRMSFQSYQTQARNQGAQGLKPPKFFFAPLEKCVGHNLKLLDIV